MLDGLEVTPKLLYGKWRLNRHAEGQIPRLNNLFVKLGFDSRCAYLCNFCRKPSITFKKIYGPC